MKKIRKVAVLGAGSGGLMCAADMGSQGYEVALFSREEDKLTEVRAKGGIDVLDIDSRPTGIFGKVALVTCDIRAALEGAQVILNPVPYFACEEYARLVAPHLEEGQVVLYLGKGGACLTWAKVLRELGIQRKVYLADCNTLPYGASRMGERPGAPGEPHPEPDRRPPSRAGTSTRWPRWRRPSSRRSTATTIRRGQNAIDSHPRGLQRHHPHPAHDLQRGPHRERRAAASSCSARRRTPRRWCA